MRNNGWFGLTIVLFLAVSVVVGCMSEPPETAALQSTATPAPTYTTLPTYTPYPTYTPAPTATVAPTSTPSPTAIPSPTSTPLPTATPLPTSRPQPTATALPTRTPMTRPTATPTPTVAPTAAPTQPPRVEGVKYIDDPDVPYLKWEVGPEVPEEHFHGLREGIELMHSYAEFIDATQPVKPATVYLYHNLDALAPSYARVRGESVEAARQRLETVHWRGWAGGSFIFVLSGALSKSNVPPIRMIRLGAHELVHVYQNQMAAGGTPGEDQGLILRRGPVWLIEGSAEFLALRAMAYGGTIPYVTGREQVASTASRVQRPLDELTTYESVNSAPGAYELGAMACELLAATAGEGALMTYWLPPKSGTSPEENFEATFGITIDEFYRMFEEHTTAGFPELDLPDIAPRIPLAEADREALTALYRSTGGVHWANDDNWLSDAPGNHWHGVTTDANGHVTVLDLRDNRLNGEIPPELGDLVNLRELRLQDNQLSGGGTVGARQSLQPRGSVPGAQSSEWPYTAKAGQPHQFEAVAYLGQRSDRRDPVDAGKSV